MSNSMLARFNYTNRLKIDKSSVRISARNSKAGPPNLRIERLDLPAEALKVHGEAAWLNADVYVEAWRIRTNSHFRKHIGKVSAILKNQNPVFSGLLDSFEDMLGISYRIKVVSTDKKILAQADHLKSAEDTPAGQGELIQVYPDDLGEQVWMLDWSDMDAGPRVLVNKNLPNPADFFTTNPTIKAIVLPHIIRSVLTAIVVMRLRGTLENYEWPNAWLGFVGSFFSTSLETESESDVTAMAWVDDAIASFCNAHKFFSGMEAQLSSQLAEEA